MYDVTSRLPVLEQAIPVRFPDDVVVVIMFGHADEVEIYSSETIWTIESWLEDFGLKITEHKTEMVFLTNCSVSHR